MTQKARDTVEEERKRGGTVRMTRETEEEESEKHVTFIFFLSLQLAKECQI